ncbi:hypothetical protein ElyMa_005889200 [Elysia marginata]|uniref:Secreted protein n=1 Tax=Elysia marginata TaxID=1093978 RepID=A0AAV4G2X5_9GAST|nr:hypothetical protein ElyMa_005889200 [Elysia marginata]
MRCKIVRIITTTIIIIITYENLSSHTDKKKTQIATSRIKLWKLWNLEWLRWTTFANIFVKSPLFHTQRTVTRTVTVTVSAKQQYLGISVIKRRIKVKKDTSVAHVKSEVLKKKMSR